MLTWQSGILIGLIILNVVLFVVAFRQCFLKNNSYGLTNWLIPIGIFVWGDALIYSPFWIGAAMTCLLLKDWLLFCLTVSVYWAVRGLGETIFWLNHQFSTKHIYPAKDLPFYFLVKNDSIWFIYQITAQCVTVVGIILSIYFGSAWVRSLAM
jgi:hypothetical protein